VQLWQWIHQAYACESLSDTAAKPQGRGLTDRAAQNLAHLFFHAPPVQSGTVHQFRSDLWLQMTNDDLFHENLLFGAAASN
jgi:hypothetical protein